MYISNSMLTECNQYNHYLKKLKAEYSYLAINCLFIYTLYIIYTLEK